MPSTYSPNLRIELIANGEQSGTWGSTTNNNLGALLENAISGYVDVVVTSADQALVALNGVNDEARNMIINFSSTSTVGANFTVYVPPAEKFYIFRNNTAYVATVRAATTLNGTTPTNNGGSPPVFGLSVVIPSGKTVMVYCDGKSPLYDVVDALNHVDGSFSVSGPLAANSLSLTNPLPETSGGTGFSAYIANSLLYAADIDTLLQLSPSTAGLPLLTQGPSAAPTWGQVDLATAVTGDLPVTNLNGGIDADNTKFWRGDGTWATPAGAGDVIGPGTSTNNEVPRFDGITGTQLKNSSVTISDAGQLSAVSFAGSLSSSSFTGALSTANGGTGLTTIGTANQLLSVNGTGTGLTYIAPPSSMIYPGAGIAVSTGTAWGTSFNNTTTPITQAYGGTGFNTYAIGDILVCSSANTLTKLAAGTSGQFLKTNGTASAPSWGSLSSSISGTPNQITVTGTTSLTLSTPQSIGTTSSVQFGSFGVGTAASGTSGEIRATNNITAYYSSDARLKINVRPIDSALAALDKIRGVRFDWTDEYLKEHGGEDPVFNRKQDVGLIAQEVQAVLPEIVTERDNGYLAIKYDRVVALLVQAVKELKEEVEELKRAK